MTRKKKQLVCPVCLARTGLGYRRILSDGDGEKALVGWCSHCQVVVEAVVGQLQPTVEDVLWLAAPDPSIQ